MVLPYPEAARGAFHDTPLTECAPLATVAAMKQIDEQLRYDHPPEKVFALISTGSFQLEIISHIGGKDAEVLEETGTAEGGARVVTRQRTGVELPGFARN